MPGRVRSGRRRRRLGVLALVVSSLLAGGACSSGVDTGPHTVLQVLMTDDWVTPPFVAAVREFERTHPDVRVDVDEAPISHMLDSVAAAVRSGEAPDVVQAHAFSAAAQGLAQPVDDLWARRLDRSDFLPGAIDDVTWGDRLYGVPLDTNALFLLYNADLFASAGVPAPDGRLTFEAFEQAARTLSSPDGSRRALAIPTSSWWTYGWVRAAGGELMHVDGSGRVQLTLDAPEVVAALDYLARLVDAKLAFPPDFADSYSSDALALFRSGSAATLATGTWDLAVLRRDAEGDRYRSSPLPAGTAAERAGSVMGGSSMFVPNGSEHRELAFEFMTHVVSDHYALRFAKEEGRLPVRSRMYRDPFFRNPEMVAVVEQLPSASPMKLTAFPEAHDVFADAVDRILRRGEDAATVMAAAQRQAQALVPASP